MNVSLTNLGKNIFKVLSGSACSKIFTFLLFPLHSFTLTPNEFGQVEILYSIILFLTPIVGFQVFETFLSTFSSRNLKSSSNAAILLLFGLAFVLPLFTLMLGYQYEERYLLYIYLFTSLNILSSFCKNILRGLNRFTEIALHDVFQSFLLVVFSFLFLWKFELGINGYFYAYILSIGCGSVFILSRIRLKDFFSFDSISCGEIRKLFLFSIPFVLNVVTWWFIEFSDRLFIVYFLDFDAAGIYAAAMRMYTACITLNMLLYNPWQAQSFHALRVKNSDFFDVTFKAYLSFTTLVISILLLSVKPIYSYFLAEEYYSAHSYTLFLVLASAFSGLSYFYGIGYYLPGKSRGIFTSSVCALVINIILNALFLPLYGISAAAASTLLAYVLLTFLRARDNNSVLNIKYDFVKIVFSFALLILQIIMLIVFEGVLFPTILLLCLLVLHRVEVVMLYNSILEMFQKRYAK